MVCQAERALLVTVRSRGGYYVVFDAKPGPSADSDSSSNTIGERVSGAVVEPVKVDELDFGAAGS
jgi:hypothetical protein